MKLETRIIPVEGDYFLYNAFLFSLSERKRKFNYNPISFAITSHMNCYIIFKPNLIRLLRISNFHYKRSYDEI